MASSTQFCVSVTGFETGNQIRAFIEDVYKIVAPPTYTDGGLGLRMGSDWLTDTGPIHEYSVISLLAGADADMDFSIRRGGTNDGLLLIKDLALMHPGLTFEMYARQEDSSPLDADIFIIKGGVCHSYDWRLAPPGLDPTHTTHFAQEHNDAR